MTAMSDVLEMVKAQAEDDLLWLNPETAPETYLQQALKKLHQLIEEACTPQVSHLDMSVDEYHEKTTVFYEGIADLWAEFLPEERPVLLGIALLIASGNPESARLALEYAIREMPAMSAPDLVAN